MQLIEKPEIDLVLEVHKGAAKQEVEKNDRYTDKLKTHSCLKEFKTANFETRNPKTRFFTQSSTLSGNTCKAEDPGLVLLQNVKKGHLDFNLRLTENHLQAITDWATEYCSCPLTQEIGN